MRGRNPRTAFFCWLARLVVSRNYPSNAKDAILMQIQMRDITKIKPYDNNPRLNDDAVDAVAASIKAFGFRQPVVTDDGEHLGKYLPWVKKLTLWKHGAGLASLTFRSRMMPKSPGA
jgi:hypothetical protein